jgi:gamma-glutamylcyclotransferase (GGCT)/AIG2-like uncharacterized protein YtfP
VTLHFAYGSNMSRALMGAHAPDAQPAGRGQLAGYRFIITRDGYASVVPAAGGIVHGVLWRLAPRDVASLNIYESVESGLYRRVFLPVSCKSGRGQALIYVGRDCIAGRPKPGYLDVVVQAARDWQLPEAYVRSLQRHAPARWPGVRAAESGEIG